MTIQERKILTMAIEIRKKLAGASFNLEQNFIHGEVLYTFLDLSLLTELSLKMRGSSPIFFLDSKNPI